MERKESHDILAACKSRNELKAALHDHFGFSVDAARAKVLQWFNASAKDDEFSQAGVARAFRSLEKKRDARMDFLRSLVLESAKAEAKRTPGGFLGFFTNGETGRHGFKAAPEPFYDSAILGPIQERMAGELAAELDEFKDRGPLEAKLVRLNWQDAAIAEYLEDYAPR